MSRKRFLLWGISSVLLLAGISWSLVFHAVDNRCDVWPIYISPYDLLPHIEVQIEGQNHSFLLDLGSKFEASIRTPLLESLQHKKHLGEASWTGIKGNFYRTKNYRIRKVKIGNTIFKNFPAKQEDDKFLLTDAVFHDPKIQTEEEYLTYSIGSIGRPILSYTNLLLDFPNSQICATNSLDQLKALGYQVDSWHKITFTLDRGIVLDVTTDFGQNRFLLDTGASFSFLDQTLAPPTSPEQAEKEPLTIASSTCFFEGIDYGSLRFRPIPWPEIGKGLHGIIGMDFLKDHVLYIDYKKRHILLGHKQRVKNVQKGMAEFDLTFMRINRVPILQLPINDRSYSLAFDTGSGMELALKTETLHAIDTIPMGNWSFQTNRGEKKKLSCFFLKTLNLDNIHLNNIRICADDRVQDSYQHDAHLSGVIGRNFLTKVNFLLDFSKKKAYASNDFEALLQKGYDVQTWTAIPYRMTNWGILVTLKTDLGPTRFLIATGLATLIRDTLSPHKERWTSETCSFGPRNFGPTQLAPSSQIPCPEEVDGMLGNDFLGKYPIYFDNLDQILYVGESPLK